MKFIGVEHLRELPAEEVARESSRFIAMASVIEIRIRLQYWPEVLVKIGVPPPETHRLIFTCKATQTGLTYETWRRTGMLIAHCLDEVFSLPRDKFSRVPAYERAVWVGNNPHSVSFERQVNMASKGSLMQCPSFFEKLELLDREIAFRLRPPS